MKKAERNRRAKIREERKTEIEKQLTSIEKRIDNMFADFPTRELRRELIFNTPQFDELIMERKTLKEELDALNRFEEVEVDDIW